ncbi:MAG: indole-3-glycerol-phosphate synthase [Gemmatimonadota bacterium]
MAEFLAAMRLASERRVELLLREVGQGRLEKAVAAAAGPAALGVSGAGFDVIAEIKRRSPSAGRLEPAGGGPLTVAQRARMYAAAGAAAISVLTEPDEFGGSLDDLTAAAAAVQIPVLRKDFLVHPIQVLEARAAGASGVLIIVRLLEDGPLLAMLDAVRRCGMFVLLEAFDGHDLSRAGRLLHTAPDLTALVGLNSRDLRTLRVDALRFERLADSLPGGLIAVAESGLSDPSQARSVVRLGYRMALIGGALMSAADPAQALSGLIAAGRQEAEACASA